MVPSIQNDLPASHRRHEPESEIASSDLLSTHRMLKTGCIIFLPLLLTFLITAVSLAYMTANSDGRSGPSSSPTIAGRHATDDDADTHTTRRWETGFTPVTPTKTAIASRLVTSTSPSSSGHAQQDVVSFFNESTSSTAERAIKVTDSTTRKGWFAVAASWNPPRMSRRAPTTTATTPLASTRKQAEAGLVDDEDVSDAGDRVDPGQRDRKDRRRTRKLPLPGGSASTISTEEASATMDIMELLGLAKSSTTLTVTVRLSKRARPLPKNGPALIRRRQRSSTTTSGKPSRLPRRIRDRLFNRPRKNPFPRISPITTYTEHDWEDTIRRRKAGDKTTAPRRLVPALVTRITSKTWPHDLLAAEAEVLTHRPRNEDGVHGRGRNFDRRFTRRPVPRQRKTWPHGGSMDRIPTQRFRVGTRRLSFFKRPTSTTKRSFPLGSEDNRAGLITEEYYDEE